MPPETTDPLTLAAFILAETDWGTEDGVDIAAPPSDRIAFAEGAEGGTRWSAR